MKDINRVLIFAAGALLLAGCKMKEPHINVTGEMMKWHTVTLEVPGHYSGEYDHKNPFLDYRLDVEFTHGDLTHIVPGYFAANGAAGEKGTFAGNIWKVKFTPDREGTWTYRVHFHFGESIAVADSFSWGEPMFMNGHTGSFDVGPSDKEAPDFRATGRLVNNGQHYLEFSETGEIFIKTGAGSPENFLAYAGFDQTPASHRYEPHASDWEEGDPDWGDAQGKNIIGAVNYLAASGVNSMYMLTMNVMGDGNDVWPWVNPYERTRYDISKLEQWDWVFSHMQSKGIALHLITSERENQLLLDQGETWHTRKLYYRELIARFGHHPGVIINLGEENGHNYNTFHAQDTRMRKEMANYISAVDPYGHPIVVHTHVHAPDIEAVLTPLLGFENLDGPSLQIEYPRYVHESVLRWRKASADAGNPWICNMDEFGHYKYGVVPDAEDPGHDSIRSDALWGTLMAGGAGVSWYFGYVYSNGDLDLEDFRSRENMWKQARIAREFFEQLPLTSMKPSDQLVIGNGTWCLSDPGEIYVIYLPINVNYFTLKDAEALGEFDCTWFNPRTGESTQGEVQLLEGGKRIQKPAGLDDKDWVCKLTKVSA